MNRIVQKFWDGSSIPTRLVLSWFMTFPIVFPAFQFNYSITSEASDFSYEFLTVFIYDMIIFCMIHSKGTVSYSRPEMERWSWLLSPGLRAHWFTCLFALRIFISGTHNCLCWLDTGGLHMHVCYVGHGSTHKKFLGRRPTSSLEGIHTSYMIDKHHSFLSSILNLAQVAAPGPLCFGPK